MSADAALTFLLEKLTQVFKDYVNLKAEAKNELRQLEGELRLFKCFLGDSADEPETTRVSKEMLNKIRETVYDIEDIIEKFLTKANTKTLKSQVVNKLGTKMEEAVKSIRATDAMKSVLDYINSKANDKKRDEAASKSYATVFTTGQQSNKQDKVVDFEDEATVIEYLMETKEKLDVIAITGMFGLGKTTFAWKIFGHQSVIRKFKFRIWVHVSEKFNRKDVFQKILDQIVPKKTRTSNYKDLIDAVRGCLENESFLLVTDEIWTEQDWNEIRKILPEHNREGKVLVTTREIDVAKRANISRSPVELQALGENKSLELLKLEVFDNSEDCPMELEETGKDIVKKCCGVPLAILVVGGVLKGLSTKQPIPILEGKWLDVSKTVSNILKKDEKKTITNAVELSYKRLSYELRLCFLYTGLFPENQEISTSTLTQLWIAEGFVQKVEGESFEETAEKILDTLINMNLLMIIRKSPDQVKTCRVHDVICGFCRTKAKDENLFREIKKSKGVFDPPVSEVPNFRRLCFSSDPTEFLSERCKVPRVRSFLCLSKESVDLDPTHISIISDAFKMLRVLNCKFINFREFPKVKKLRLLKHVTLSIGNLDVVPEQISLLVNLETLIILTKSHSITVEANIWKMIQLRRLKTKATILLTKTWWEGNDQSSETLQTISRLSHESCDASIPEKAPNLKVLAIQGKVADIFKTLRMEDLGQLEKLKLVNDQSTTSDNPLVLTRQHCFPPNLNSLTLSSTYLKWEDHMPILANIKLLKVLKLKANAFTDGMKWDATDGDFPNLQFLLIENMDLLNWNASTHSFPSLTWLVVKNCKKLLTIPRSLGKHLEKLEIGRVNESVVHAAKIIESDIQIEIISKPRWKVPLMLTIAPGYGYLGRQLANKWLVG